METADLFNALVSGEITKGSEAFDALMQDRIAARIDALRPEVAASALGVDVVTQDDEE
jgi:hypothetical protein